MDFAALAVPLSRRDLSAAEKAATIVWWDHRYGTGNGLSVYEIAQRIIGLRVGNPNRTALERHLDKSALVIKVNGRYSPRVGAVNEINRILGDDEVQIIEDSDLYIPKAIWQGTRTYIEKIALQLCGCWQQHFYDAAAVMLRRLLETLLIEAYLHESRAVEITDPSGNFLMLGDLVNRAIAPGGLILGRESKAMLNEIKKSGDRSAHNRKYNAVRQDLSSIRSGARVAVQELITMSFSRKEESNGTI